VLKNGYDKIVLSNDKDYFQLVDESTTIFRPVKTKDNPNGEYVDMEWMTNNEKCYPYNYILVKALAGCTSDKIPGIEGVGEKSVKNDFPFLEEHVEYGVDAIIDHAKKNVKKYKKYEKYIVNETLLRDNETLVQLVDPDISLKSVDTIYNIVETGSPKFNPYKFRLKLMSEGISPSNIDNWIGTFATIKQTRITLKDGGSV